MRKRNEQVRLPWAIVDAWQKSREASEATGNGMIAQLVDDGVVEAFDSFMHGWFAGEDSELNGRTIAKMFTEWALAEGGTGGFLAWAAWISGVAPPEVQVWIDYKMPVGGNSEFYQRFLG